MLVVLYIHVVDSVVSLLYILRCIVCRCTACLLWYSSEKGHKRLYKPVYHKSFALSLCICHVLQESLCCIRIYFIWPNIKLLVRLAICQSNAHCSVLYFSTSICLTKNILLCSLPSKNKKKYQHIVTEKAAHGAGKRKKNKFHKK